MKFKTFAFTAAKTPDAQAAEKRLRELHPNSTEPEEADVIVALGGDGFMLQTLHRYLGSGIPIYGLNRGSVGFLMNAYTEDGLMERLARAEPINLHPLRMEALDRKGRTHTGLAINEVSILRATRLAAKIRILVDGILRLDEMICDGVLVATPAGSTAYNHAVGGPILPMGADLMAVTPISAFRPRRWRGALLPRHASVTFEVLNGSQRRVNVSTDLTEVHDVAKVTVREDRSAAPTLLFDPEHDLEERILKEQFLP